MTPILKFQLRKLTAEAVGPLREAALKRLGDLQPRIDEIKSAEPLTEKFGFGNGYIKSRAWKAAKITKEVLKPTLEKFEAPKVKLGAHRAAKPFGVGCLKARLRRSGKSSVISWIIRQLRLSSGLIH